MMNNAFDEEGNDIRDDEFMDDLNAQAEEHSMLDMLFERQGERLFLDDEAEQSVLNHAISFIPKEKAKAETEEEYDEDDFYCKPAFIAIRNAICLYIDSETHPQLRERAAEWIFTPNLGDADELTFNLCCDALECSPMLVIARLQFQLYKQTVVMDAPLPFLAVELPQLFELEILGKFGEMGVTVAENIWDFPSIRADHLVNICLSDSPKEEVIEITEKMEKAGFIGVKAGHWYFTGRNPDLLNNGSSFQWTRIKGL